jgi:hypothetical protein
MVGKPALRVVGLSGADEMASLQTGAMVGEGAFTINDVIGQFRNGFAYSAMNNAGRVAILYEFFPHGMVEREGYDEVKPRQGEETDFATLVAAYEASVEALREADFESLPRVTTTLWANGTFYVATEERSLQGYDRLMEAGSATGGKRPRVIANALGQALEALHKMHGLGFEHGAITPDMIHISSEGDVRITGPILLTSLAQPLIEDESGAVVPNPFIAPELLEDPAGVTVKSDLYSLAASFYNAITRRPPSDAKSRVEAAALRVADNYSPLRKVAVLYRPAFRRALDAAMGFAPAERPNTAENWLAHVRLDQPDDQATEINACFFADLERAAPVAEPEVIVEAPVPEPAPEPVAELPPVVEAAPVVTAPVVAAPAPAYEAPPRAARNVEPAAPAAAQKSNMGLILGAGGLVAALAVAGVMFMGGGEEAPAPEAVTETATATETEAPLPTALADEAAVEPAPAETEVAAAEPEVTEPEAAAPEVAEPEPTEPAAETEVAAAESAVSDEPAPETGSEPAEVAAAPEATGDVVAPAESEAAPAAEEVAALPAPTEAETAVAEPEPAPEPAPEPVAEPAVEVAAEPAAVAEEPDLTGDEAEAAEAAANVRAADDLDDLLLGGGQPQPDANAAGEAIDLSSSPVLSARMPYLPFRADPANPTVLATVESGAPEWLAAGVTIATVNGAPISSMSDIAAQLRASGALAEAESVDLTLGVKAEGSDTVTDQTLTVAVVSEVALLNGLRFAELPAAGGTVKTMVVAAPASSNDDQMKIGDEIVAYVPSNERIGSDARIGDLITRQLQSGTTQFPFAVRRDGTMWITTFNYGLLGD